MSDELKRDSDGVLMYRPGGRYYEEPQEAIKIRRAGELRLGCNAQMYDNFSSWPCSKTPKYDPDANGRPTKCGTHCAEANRKRQEKRAASNAAYMAKIEKTGAIRSAEKALEYALRQIASGHNDPRGLAQDVLSALDAARGGQE
jgi:hypothetical protein